MVIAHTTAERAERRRRADEVHRSQARQAHCRIVSIAFRFAAGSREYELFASSTYCSSAFGTPFHRRALSDTRYATKVHFFVAYSVVACATQATTARCFQTRTQAMKVGLPSNV